MKRKVFMMMKPKRITMMMMMMMNHQIHERILWIVIIDYYYDLPNLYYKVEIQLYVLNWNNNYIYIYRFQRLWWLLLNFIITLPHKVKFNLWQNHWFDYFAIIGRWNDSIVVVFWEFNFLVKFKLLFWNLLHQ